MALSKKGKKNKPPEKSAPRAFENFKKLQKVLDKYVNYVYNNAEGGKHNANDTKANDKAAQKQWFSVRTLQWLTFIFRKR